MKKHGIRAPRKSKGETAAVTIANQDRQIQLLIDRVAKLQQDNDAISRACELEDRTCVELRARLNSADIAHARMLGWMDCARELLCGGRRVEITGRRLEPFPSVAPGV